jgi:NAD(P)-dependent dehydrogenase (short-subunit alcohol dehydrogenase family)
MFQASGLTDKAVIITGGTRGIGRACVDLFSANEADVLLLS